MKKSFHAFLLLSVLAIVGISNLHAQPAGDRQSTHHRQQDFKPGALRKELNLTDDQVAKIKTAFVAQKEPLKASAQKIRTARAQLRDVIQSGAPEAQIRSAAASIGAAEGDLAVVRAALFAQIKPILTPEQLEKFHQLQTSRR